MSFRDAYPDIKRIKSAATKTILIEGEEKAKKREKVLSKARGTRLLASARHWDRYQEKQQPYTKDSNSFTEEKTEDQKLSAMDGGRRSSRSETKGGFGIL